MNNSLFSIFNTKLGYDCSIELEGMEFHAFHGCLPQEREEGNTFIVDFYAEACLDTAMQSDSLGDTVDYGEVYDVIAEQVAKNGCVDDRTRMELAQEAFAHTAAYDTMIKDYLAEQLKK